MEISVSAIIYVKNAKDFIEECIRSVMNQTLKSIEIIVVDGGSTDGTLQIIEKLMEEDVRIKKIETAPSVGIQFNTALDIAKGEYISVCEADDYIRTDMYEKQYKLAKEHDLDMVRSNYLQFLKTSQGIYEYEVQTCYKKEIYGKVLDLEKSDRSLIQELGVNGFWTGIYKKDFLVKNNIRMNETRGAAHQDITFSYLTQMLARRVWYMEETFYHYRIDNPSASAFSSGIYRQHIEEYALLKENLEKRFIWKKEKNMYLSWMIGSLMWVLDSSSKTEQRNIAEDIYFYLNDEFHKEKYEVAALTQKAREVYNMIGYNENKFVDSSMNGFYERNRLDEFFDNLEEINNEIVIFGIGNIGRIIVDFFIDSKKMFVVTDNNANKQGTLIKGNEVFVPEDVVCKYKDCKVLIANKFNYEEIREQMIMLGVSSQNIYVCDDEEYFLRGIFVKRRGSKYGA